MNERMNGWDAANKIRQNNHINIWFSILLFIFVCLLFLFCLIFTCSLSTVNDRSNINHSHTFVPGSLAGWQKCKMFTIKYYVHCGLLLYKFKIWWTHLKISSCKHGIVNVAVVSDDVCLLLLFFLPSFHYHHLMCGCLNKFITKQRYAWANSRIKLHSATDNRAAISYRCCS